MDASGVKIFWQNLSPRVGVRLQVEERKTKEYKWNEILRVFMLCRWMMGNLYGSKKSSIFWLPVLHLGFSLFLSHIHRERERHREFLAIVWHSCTPAKSARWFSLLHAGSWTTLEWFHVTALVSDGHCALFTGSVPCLGEIWSSLVSCAMKGISVR